MENRKLWPYLVVAPAVVFLLMYVVYLEGGFFPFGDKTVSWCDMSQQVVPLLTELKDVLSGEQGIFLSHTNAGGMNYWAVFFFFLGSPLSLLVAFVEKANIMRFMNFLTALKLAAAAFTSALYFCRKAKKEKRDPWLGVLLSVLYAFSIYALMYYQNSIWLDEMCLFPLLVVSLGALKEKKIWPYTLIITIMVSMNYYIGFMVAVFVLLRIGIFFVFVPHKEKRTIAWLFILGSLCALVFSSPAWLPSLLQYTESARGTGILENLVSQNFVERLNTTMPLLFSMGSLFAVLLVNLIWWRPLKKNQLGDVWMLLLLAIPAFIKPIDLLWHAGSYMAFPCRFAFMLVFEALVCAYNSVGAAEKKPFRAPKWLKWVSSVLALPLTLGFVTLLYRYGKNHLSEMTAYTETLWGDDEALKALGIAFLICLGVYILLYLLRRLGANKVICLSMASLCLVAECMFNLNVYVASVTTTDERYRDYIAMEEPLGEMAEDDEYAFTRVKSGTHISYENWEGMLGLPSATHYTSLSSTNWLFMMKRLGYNAYWMKIASYGGTLFSDALLNMRYELNWRSGAKESTFYKNDTFSVSTTDYYLPLGILTDTNLASLTFTNGGRIEYQEELFEALFPGSGKLFTKYTTNSSESGIFEWKIRITDETVLYLDAFSAYTTKLNEPINNALSVFVNGKQIKESYPTQTYNNILNLGTFENEVVTVKVTKKKNVNIESFGVYGLNTGVLAEACATESVLNLSDVNNGFSGSFNTGKTQNVLLSVPYSKGYTVKVNGKKTETYSAAQGFLAFVLPEGSGTVEISFVPSGLLPACIAAGVLFVICVVLAILIRRKKWVPFKKHTSALGLILCKLSFPLMIIAFYIFPVLWNLLG